MGWKISIIIVNKPTKVDNEKLLRDLGIKRFIKTDDTTFENTIGLFTNKIYIGEYKDNLIIYEWTLPDKIIQNNDTESEKLLVRKFPNSEICIIKLVSNVNFWGYKIINKGRIIRHRAGDGDKGTYIDSGAPLEEEIPLLNKSSIDGDGNKFYKFDEQPDELFSEDQVGENFVFEICKRYFGETLDTADELLYNTIFIGYQKKAWWRFW